jgi:hypothetical protein
MLVQVIPLDASKPNVIELERVYLPFVIASDDKHGVSKESEWCARGRTRVGLILGENPNDLDRSLI